VTTPPRHSENVIGPRAPTHCPHSQVGALHHPKTADKLPFKRVQIWNNLDATRFLPPRPIFPQDVNAPEEESSQLLLARIDPAIARSLPRDRGGAGREGSRGRRSEGIRAQRERKGLALREAAHPHTRLA
jgi:hypothetical protein